MKKNLLIILYIFFSINITFSQTNWQLLNPKPTTNTGKDIHFVSNNIGYIITSNELLETTDGGLSWYKKQNIAYGNDMSFHNSIGYIVGDNGYVLKSTDNGASWFQISTGFYHVFNTVNIIDENNIILSSSNHIVKTNDGGTTWEILYISIHTVNKTFFVSPLIGHAACKEGKMLKTIDGGQSWYITQSTNVYPSDFFTVYFVNENIGFSTREHSEMHRTTDGGETWSEVSGASQKVYDFHFLDENIGFLIGQNGVPFKTTDSGITWTPILFQPGHFSNTIMYGICFQDSNIGYVTGDHGRIIRTADGGNTWTQHSPTYDDFRQVQFLNNNIGYAQTRNYFYKTTDSGNTWVLIDLQDIGAPVFSSNFTFVNEFVGYASIPEQTAGGSVIKTTDGGLTWLTLNIGINVIDEPITSIFFLDETNGFISGGSSQKKVFKTTDGGLTWTQGGRFSFSQIQFLNIQVGYASRAGKIYKTSDSGNSWEYVFEGDRDVNSFHFLDENIGYFVVDEAFIYKTADGGANWQELPIPYGFYDQVKFYSKNVGYIADEDGKLYRTMSGGKNWELLTTHYSAKSIEFIGETIFTAGLNGKIYRSEIEFDSVVLNLNQAENVSNSSVSLTGSVTSNEGEISGIQFEYSTDYSFDSTISTNPSIISANESLNFSVDITELNPSTKYYFRLKASYNSIDFTSQILDFTTLPDYEIITQPSYTYTTTTAEVSGRITSNEHDIANAEFQYGTSADSLNSSVNGTPFLVSGNTTKNIHASLNNLKPKTQYFFRLKATHQGEDIYGNIESFTTNPEYDIVLFVPNINGNEVTLIARPIAYSQDITDIVFEYGTINYESEIVASPSQVNANTAVNVYALLSNLDTDSVYYFRVKAIHNGEIIYSEEGVFNLSGEIIIVSGTMKPDNYSFELIGLINSNGSDVSDIHFEYGITDNFGSSVAGTPSYAFGYSTTLITALINNPLSNQTYFYRLGATHNGNTIYSDTYQHTTGALGLNDFFSDEEIFIYPNPTNDFVNIKLENSETVKSIELYNIEGKLVMLENKLNSADIIKIDLSNFEEGIYFIKVYFENRKTIALKLMRN